MNKALKVILAIIGGIDVVINIFTPIILATLWINLAGTEDWKSYFFFGAGLLATLFRSIKIGIFKLINNTN